MRPVYFETRFRINGPIPAWPVEFVIITAYATTGETWTSEQNQTADRRLESELKARGGQIARLIGYSPRSGHAEPSWAVKMPFDEACDLGVRYRQEAIYFVRDDDLSVSFCDSRKALVRVGSFRERLDEMR